MLHWCDVHTSLTHSRTQSSTRASTHSSTHSLTHPGTLTHASRYRGIFSQRVNENASQMWRQYMYIEPSVVWRHCLKIMHKKSRIFSFQISHKWYPISERLNVLTMFPLDLLPAYGDNRHNQSYFSAPAHPYSYKYKFNSWKRASLGLWVWWGICVLEGCPASSHFGCYSMEDNLPTRDEYSLSIST